MKKGRGTTGHPRLILEGREQRLLEAAEAGNIPAGEREAHGGSLSAQD